MNDWIMVEVIHRGHETVLELLFGCDADMAQDRAGELGEEAFDEIEPGAMLGSEGELKSAGGLLSEPSSGLPGDVRRIHIEKSNESRCGAGKPCREA